MLQNIRLIFNFFLAIPGFENMANLDKLPPRGATVFAAPIKITEGSGAQVRAFALGWDGTKDPCNKKNSKKEKSED